MKQQNNKIDFSNQIIYVGIDVHKKSWKVNLRANLMELKIFSMNPSTKELRKHLHKNYPGARYKSVYEAGFCGYWIDRELKKEGIENIIVNPADVPTKNKERRYRTDKIDARKLARELESGTLTGIYIPTEKQIEFRSLNRLRHQLVKDQTRLKNRIKSLLLYYGKQIPENYEIQNWSGNFIKHLETKEFISSSGKDCLSEQLGELKQKRERLSNIVKKLRKEIKENKEHSEIIKNLESVPGIGFKTAVTLLAELIDIKRFSSIDRLCGYVGLVPSVDSTSDRVKVLGLNRRHNKYLRNMIIEAAWVAVRKDPALTHKYGELWPRMGKQKAIIRIAKKLLSRIYHVWKENKPYENSKMK